MNDLPQSLAIAGAWGYIGRKFLDELLSTAKRLPDRLQPVMGRESYDLQYLIYTVALTRHLSRRLPDFRYGRDFGGVFYLFLRGMDPAHGEAVGVFHDRPAEALIRAPRRGKSGISQT